MFIKRAEAKTLAARVMKRLSTGELVHGHELYWTMRPSDEANSWSGVALVERMPTNDTVSRMAAKHMKALDAVSDKAKLFVLDAGHGMDVLNNYQACKHSDMVMRLKGHQVFYRQAGAYQGVERLNMGKASN